jgi:predicted aspartyl protease
MGRVTVTALLENIRDLWSVQQGSLQADQARRVEVPDALVDTGATMLSVPTRLIGQLGLERRSSRRINSSTGTAEVGVYEAVRLVIQGRDCTMDVLEVPDTVPVLIGQIPMEALDFVVDPKSRQLIGNPAHGGEYVIDMY